MTQRPPLEVEFTGLAELQLLTSAMAEHMSAELWEMVNNALIRVAQAPGLGVSIIDEQYTLVGSLTEAFANDGRSVYLPEGWAGYIGEERYAALKIALGGGSNIGIWQNARDPLRDTLLDASNAEHIEDVSGTMMRFGSSRHYALDFHEGRWQPFDELTAPARPVLFVTDAMAFQYAKGAQRIIFGLFGRGGLRQQQLPSHLQRGSGPPSGSVIGS